MISQGEQKRIAVSVIVPLRNNERYLDECLDSVCAQTLRSIEVIVVDDASTDRSAAMAETRALADARISVVRQPLPVGAGPSRNLGMQRARGEYLAFMDSDDRYPSPDVLEKLYHTARGQEADICGGSLYTIDGQGQILRQDLSGQVFAEERWYSFAEYQFEGGFYRFLYRRAFLEQEGLRFPDLKRFQDSVFCVEAMLRAGRFYAMPLWSYAYRKTHKKVIWDSRSMNDHLRGVCHLLQLSAELKLARLHGTMARNFFVTLRRRISRNFNGETVKLCGRIVRNIRFGLCLKCLFGVRQVSAAAGPTRGRLAP